MSMEVEQLAVFLENKSGRLAEITSIIAIEGVNIRALSVADTADFGILRLIVDDVEKTQKALKANGFTVGKTNVLAVEVEDKTGGLANVLKVIHEVDLNVEYMYAFVNKTGENAVLIFRFEDMEKALVALQERNFTLLTGEQICAL
ncbi:related to acetolactate synthase, small subunit [Desulfotalea psychrophila LSv54]|uniref:Related to acetolactate synthase, small subunit n=2 Tax=Desulfotalea psychrophila TaxID=84980 RepID=Q6ANS8_DESPS|nr:related to acetolactate synthase, small subunit [Desulfotalea psychrophila LSv54]